MSYLSKLREARVNLTKYNPRKMQNVNNNQELLCYWGSVNCKTFSSNSRNQILTLPPAEGRKGRIISIFSLQYKGNDTYLTKWKTTWNGILFKCREIPSTTPDAHTGLSDPFTPLHQQGQQNTGFHPSGNIRVHIRRLLKWIVKSSIYLKKMFIKKNSEVICKYWVWNLHSHSASLRSVICTVTPTTERPPPVSNKVKEPSATATMEYSLAVPQKVTARIIRQSSNSTPRYMPQTNSKQRPKHILTHQCSLQHHS